MPDRGDTRRRVLFVAEAVSLAHVTRPLVLAQALDPSQYEVHFASARFDDFVFGDVDWRRWHIDSISPERFLSALSRGSPVYDFATLSRYVEADLRLLNEVRPHLVVGDFRLSLAVSARVAGIPYAALSNAHWSPYAKVKFELPGHPLERFVGFTAGNLLFRLARPFIFRYHAMALNRLRKRHALAPVGDVRHAYTESDLTLYADTPGVVPTSELPGNHEFLGPILWSPSISYPDWWKQVPVDRPVVYVTLGSTGQVDCLPTVVEALAELSVSVLVATAGRVVLPNAPDNVWAADFLPGTEAARRSQFVVCSGGSATAYQALAEGVPVLGIVWNMDQHLTMACIAKRRAGALLREQVASKRTVKELAETILKQNEYQERAQDISAEFKRYPAPIRFANRIKYLVEC